MASGGSLIGALRVTLGLDTAQFEAGTKRARATARRDMTAIQKQITGVRQAFDGLLAGATVAALGMAAKRALDYAASLGEVSQQVGVTIEQLQVYRYAATQVNLTQDQMESGLARLTKTLGEAANGNKRQATTFRDLGIAVEDANGRIYTAGEIMPRLADAFEKIKDPATQARIAADLFGRQAGQKMLPLLTQGARGIDEYRQRAHELGIVLSDDLSNAADRASDRIEEMKMQLSSNFARIVAENADAFLGLANGLMQAAGAAAQFAAKYQGIVAALGGAAIGGRIGGPKGAVVGLAGGLAWGAYDQAKNDPFALRGLSPKELSAAARDTAKMIRGGGPYGSGFQMDRAKAIQAEMQRRMAEASKPRMSVANDNLVGDGDLPTISGGGGRKGSGRAPRAERDRTEEYLRRYNQDLASLTSQELSLRQEMTTAVSERADLERQKIDLDAEMAREEIETRRIAGELTAAQAKRLLQATEYNRLLEFDLGQMREDDDLLRERMTLSRESLSAQQDLLQSELYGARTQKQREKIAMELLDLEIERRRLASEEVLALSTSTDIEKQIARQRLADLAKYRGREGQNIRDQYAGPLGSLIKSMPRDAAELREAYEAVAADGLGSLNDQLAEAITGSKSLADVFKNVSNQIVADLARIAIQRALIKPLSEALMGAEGSNGNGGLFASIGRALGLVAKTAPGAPSAPPQFGSNDWSLPGWNSGGSFNVGGIPGVDRNVLSLNGAPVARVSYGERVTVSPKSQSGSGIAQIVPSPYFDVVVDGRVMRTGAPMVSSGIRQNNQAQSFRASRQVA